MFKPLAHGIAVRAVAVGFNAWAASVRLRRVIRSLGRPRILGIDHVTIPVHDLDEARRFYCDVLGGAFLMRVDNEFFRKVGRPEFPPDTQSVFHISVLFGGATRVDLFRQDYGQAATLQPHGHYAFRVRPRDLAAWKARLERNGVPVDGPMQLGPPGQASMYFNDPFGNHLELECLGYAGRPPIRVPDMEGIAWPSRRVAAE